MEMDFLGKRAIIPRGPAVLSIKTGAPIIPSFLIRLPNDKFVMIFEEPIYPPKVKEEDISEPVLTVLIQKYLSKVEEKIRQYPNQWLMFREFYVQ